VIIETVAGVKRADPTKYRKWALTVAGQATHDGFIETAEGLMSFVAGDYICGPGAGGEYWPVKRAIFEATYVPDDPRSGA
jgi:hypothetical protein